MKKNIHAFAGCIALVIIISFWLSTIITELFAPTSIIKIVKTTIPWGFMLLIPALIITGGSGFFLSKDSNHPIIHNKMKRMPIIALNGCLILMPLAFFLSFKAKTEDFDTIFYLMQLIELVTGAINIYLLYLNMRDGITLTKSKNKKVKKI